MQTASIYCREGDEGSFELRDTVSTGIATPYIPFKSYKWPCAEWISRFKMGYCKNWHSYSLFLIERLGWPLAR